MTTRDLIKQKLSEHTKNGGVICAQSLLGVGGVQNTVNLDDKTGLIELPVSDSSNPGVVCGLALAGRRPVYIIRFAGFGWLNYWSILNYAAKSKELWGVPCPVFVRCIANEGNIGPVASNMNHSIVAHMPGVKVFAPMTAGEWEQAWNYFNTHDDVVFCSEHRDSYNIEGEYSPPMNGDTTKVSIIAVGGSRMNANSVQYWLTNQGIVTNTHHVVKLKPFDLDVWELQNIKSSKHVIIVDSDYTTCGMAEHIACHLMKHNIKSHLLGLADRTAGFAPHLDNITPSEKQIIELVKSLI